MGNKISCAANATGGITVAKRQVVRLVPIPLPNNVKITNKKEGEDGDASNYCSLTEKCKL